MKPEPQIFIETSSWDELRRFLEASGKIDLDIGMDQFQVAGYCYVCDREVQFRIPELKERVTINWRETLECSNCGLISRSRSSIHAFCELLGPRAGDRIYLTEQISPIYSQLLQRYPFLIGSEYKQGAAPGEYFAVGPSVARHEDLTALSFNDRSLHYIMTLDVLEHVHNYSAALAECFRVLKPGGQLLISVPFSFGESTEVRARIHDGEIEFLMEPIYHGDPVSSDGILCYYHFGFELLHDLENAGFVDCRVVSFISKEWGYFVPDILFRATRP